MAESRSRPLGSTAPTVAFALAAGAALSFGAGDAIGFVRPGTEEVFVLTWIVGWVLVACAAIVGGFHTIRLIRRAVSRQPVAWFEAVLVSASAAIVALVLWTHPLWGTGSGSAAGV